MHDGNCSQAAPRFFIYPRLLTTALTVLRCLDADGRSDSNSRAQFLFEVDALRVLLDHPSRVRSQGSAEVYVLPILAMASKHAGRCDGRAHRDRQQDMLQAAMSEVDFAAGPRLLACTCVMLRSLYGPPLFALLFNNSRHIVQLTKAPRTWDGRAGPAQAVVPYHSPTVFEARDCAAPRPQLAVFFGSLDTESEQSTQVRRRIARLAARTPRLAIGATERRRTPGSTCAARGACIDGVNIGPGTERYVAAKPRMAAGMRNATLCLVPEGDSPETSRLFDAVNALCFPLVLSARLPVPPSRSWAAAALVLSPQAFLRASDAELARRLDNAAAAGAPLRRRCAALRELRREMRPSCVVPRVMRAARRLVEANEAGGTLEQRTLAEELRPAGTNGGWDSEE